MNRQDRFVFERDAFRNFICSLGERELEHLMDDIKLRQEYLNSIKPENIIKGIQDDF